MADDPTPPEQPADPPITRPAGVQIEPQAVVPPQAGMNRNRPVTIHTAATQASLGGYPLGAWVLCDGVIWVSRRVNNAFHVGDTHWTLAY